MDMHDYNTTQQGVLLSLADWPSDRNANYAFSAHMMTWQIDYQVNKNEITFVYHPQITFPLL